MADPYAPIRRLNFAPTTSSFIRDSEWGGGGPADVTTWDLAGDTGWDDLGGFQSKYNQIQDNGDGTFSVIFQNPTEGKNHKYDTLVATYTQDPNTGEYVMVGEPQERRETSGMDSFQDFAEKGGLMVGGVLGGGYLGSSLAGTGATAGTTATSGGLTGGTSGGLLSGTGGGLTAGGTGGGFTAGGFNAANLGITSAGAGTTLGTAGSGLLPAAGSAAGTWATGLGSTGLTAAGGATLGGFDAAAGLAGGSGLTATGTTAGNVASGLASTGLGSSGLGSAAASGGGLLDTLQNGASTVGNYLLDNPKLIGAGLGALAGAAGSSGDDGGGGGGAYTGPMPTMSTAGWSPTATPQYMQVPTFGSNFMANQPVGHTNSGLWRYMNGAQPNAGLPQQGLMQTPQTPGRQQSLGLMGQQQPQQGLMSPQQMAPLVQQSYQAADQGFSGSGFVGTGGAPISDHYTWGGDPSARILVDNTVHQNGLYGGPNGMSLQAASDQGYYQARDDKTGEYLWVKAGQMSPYQMTGTMKVDQGGRSV